MAESPGKNKTVSLYKTGMELGWFFRWRMFWDAFMRRGVAFGGISIIIAILLIFIYLLLVVLPIFDSAHIKEKAAFSLPGPGNVTTLHLALEEQNEVALRVTADGRFIFFDARSGEVIEQQRMTLAKDVTITSFADANPNLATVALGLSNGEVLVVQHRYKVTFPDNKRLITPELLFPLGKQPVLLDTQNEPLVRLAVQVGEDGISLVAATADQRLIMATYQQQESLLDDDASYERLDVSLPYKTEGNITHLLIDQDQRELYVATKGGVLSYFDIHDKEAPVLVQQEYVTASGAELTALRSLTGGISVLLGSSDGHLSQWSLVRDKANREQLLHFRSFDMHPQAITQILPEFNRKGFLAFDSSGEFGIYHTTAHNTVLRQSLPGLQQLALSPRANGMIGVDQNQKVRLWHIENEHPEISWSSLWGKVQYESYSEPQYMWQSSSASNDFEPKFSLVPISFGTLKAAFYAMLIAIPLAIMGAIFTAQFMSPRMRQMVKPSIEIMEALPTVILGFLAGLWLAPFVEKNLPGIFTLLLIMPPGILLSAYVWHRLPERIRYVVHDGWEAALLIPAVFLIGWFALWLSPILEQAWFAGDMPRWLHTELGIDFDQRNSLVVGLAMGFAVIPTIFSIAEDALFAVPKHLVNGSLALGATAWQTLVRVVLLTASPGIFSAVMIGFGRAVGETMIVLMATGNTPVMDMSVFQGMRTLSANIAVEMPESEVASTHYRVLFLAALVLFAFTFLFNTLAEVVRQRLRRKYSSL